MLAAILALISACAIGAADFGVGAETRRQPLLVVMLISQLTCTASLLAAAIAFGGGFDSAGLGYAVAGGCLAALAVGTIAYALAAGPMGLVAPIIGMGVVIPVVVGLAGGDQVGVIQLGGMGCCLVGLVLITRQAQDAIQAGSTAVPEGSSPRRGIAYGLMAMVVTGVALVVLRDYTEVAEPVWVSANTYIVQSVVIVAAVLTTARAEFRQVAWSDASGTLPAIGAIQAIGILSLVLALNIGQLSVVAAIASLYPASTVLLARVLLREHLSRAQSAGAGIAIAGIVALAVP